MDKTYDHNIVSLLAFAPIGATGYLVHELVLDIHFGTSTYESCTPEDHGISSVATLRVCIFF
jgi:hypothetical protein